VDLLVGWTHDEVTSFGHPLDGALEASEELIGAYVPQLVAAVRGRAFTYRFDWHPEGSPWGACHCIELPFVFDTLDAWADAPMLAGGDPGEMAALAATVRSTWGSFVRTGDPQYDGGRTGLVLQ
jgi:para-nitrobenzyl esterase